MSETRGTIFDCYYAEQMATGDPDKCWDYPGCKNSEGYGSVMTGGKSCKAHRLAFERFHGREIASGLEIIHTCDNPPCMNPAHLLEDTHRNNMLDSHAKGRATTVMPTLESMAKHLANTPRGDRHWMKDRDHRLKRLGEANGGNKLTWDDVREMRRLRQEEDWLLRELAARFGVTHALVSLIVRRLLWDEEGYERRQARQPRPPLVQPTVVHPQKSHPGEGTGTAKLTWARAREIRALLAEGKLTQEDIAALFDVSQVSISRIRLGHTWKEEHDPG